MSYTLPPAYVNVTATAIYHDPDLSDRLIVTLCKLSGLAWMAEDKATLPPLLLEELLALLRCSRSALYERLNALQERGYLTYSSQQGVWHIRLVPPARPDGPATPPAPTDEAVAAALRAYGVVTSHPQAQAVMRQPHVTAARVRAWGEYLKRQPGVRNLPGLLLHHLAQGDPPPALVTSEARPPKQPTPPPPDPPPLPEVVARMVADLGWRGEMRELQAYYQQEPKRFRAWLLQAQAARVRNRAGFFLKNLRSGAWPVLSTIEEQIQAAMEDEEDEPEPVSAGLSPELREV